MITFLFMNVQFKAISGIEPSKWVNQLLNFAYKVE